MINRNNKAIILWLLTGCILVAAMVVVGGITRLTQSGLSIVEWDLISGTVAPTTETEWIEEFEKYKTSPQFREVNRDFTLEDYKSIYWWEYIHRLLGRIIGIVFIVPFLYFYFRKMIPKGLMPSLLLIFALGAFQGVLGWYMVMSGLVNEPRVSQYRLAAHLITAFITFGYTFHVALRLIDPEKAVVPPRIKNYFNAFFVLLCLQIIYGAFVAGIRAGYFFNTWPDMDGALIPEAVTTSLDRTGISAFTESIPVVQFIHRYLAYLIYAAMALFAWYGLRQGGLLRLLSLVLLALGTLQVLLGIFTLLEAVPVWLGVLHQLGAFLVFAWSVLISFRLSRGQ